MQRWVRRRATLCRRSARAAVASGWLFQWCAPMMSWSNYSTSCRAQVERNTATAQRYYPARPAQLSTWPVWAGHLNWAAWAADRRPTAAGQSGRLIAAGRLLGGLGGVGRLRGWGPGGWILRRCSRRCTRPHPWRATCTVRSCQQTRTCTRRAMVRQQYKHIAACTVYSLIATVQTSIFTRGGICPGRTWGSKRSTFANRRTTVRVDMHEGGSDIRPGFVDIPSPRSEAPAPAGGHRGAVPAILLNPVRNPAQPTL